MAEHKVVYVGGENTAISGETISVDTDGVLLVYGKNDVVQAAFARNQWASVVRTPEP